MMYSGELTFIHDVFISYAHLDNQELIEGKRGWVANFHRALEIRVAQYLGNKPDIWRDPKLHGSDAFAETVITKVHGSAVMISILSPRYVRSEWTRREVSEFVNAIARERSDTFCPGFAIINAQSKRNSSSILRIEVAVST
jgi:TIR domain